MSSSEEEELEKLLRGIAGERDPAGDDEIFGPIDGQSGVGARILVIDDLSEVIHDFHASEKAYASRDTRMNAQFCFFRIGDRPGARTNDLINWLSKQKRFEAIYIDGDLGTQGNGPDLAKLIRDRPGFKYQPIAIITANESFFLGQTGTVSGTRIMGKFDLKGIAAIRKFVTDLPDLKAQSREIFWTDCHKLISEKLDGGMSAQAAAEKMGEHLVEHYGVSGWYFRELRGQTLDAIAMNDKTYQASPQLPLSEAPLFQRNLLRDDVSKPWDFLNNLTHEEVGPRPTMAGHHVIVARVGGAIGGGVIALFTVYRKPDQPEFLESDARELHHAAVLLRLSLATQRANDRLEALVTAIGNVLTASSTATIAGSLCDFLHTQIQQALEYRDYKAKTTARLFLRGRGILERWGEDNRRVPNSLKAKGNRPISITEDCVYSRAIKDNKTKRSDDPAERSKQFINTTQQLVRSYVTVPLTYDGATIGAINLETTLDNAYKPADVSLAEAVAGVAAAAILNHRSQRFMTRLAQLTNLAVNPAAAEPSDPDAILQNGADILYELCGYSDLLLFQAQPDSSAPWQIVKAWRGEGDTIAPRDIALLKPMQQRIDDKWDRTYLKSCIDAHTDSTFFNGSSQNVPDDGAGMLRPEGRVTLSYVVVLLGNNKKIHDRAVMLFFEHPRPIPAHFEGVFAAFANFLNTIYSTTFTEIKNFGRALATARIEARQGRYYSQARHVIASHLVSIYNTVDLGRHDDPPDLIFDEVTKRIRRAEHEFESLRVLLRDPEFEDCDLVDLWNEVAGDLQSRITESGLLVDNRATALPARTDPHYTKLILFNLLDNALEHGKKGGAERIWFEALPDGASGCAVCDDGCQIDAAFVNKIFDMNETTKGTGGGQGLHIARENARDIDGDLALVRRNDANCFELRLNKGN
ncbi:sensor histidine kinase [Bradyrhizobium sp.]